MLLLKKQADEINKNFIYYNQLIDSQKVAIKTSQSSFDSLLNRFSLINCDTSDRMREVYNTNERLIGYINEHNKLFKFFDTCTHRELKFYRKYKLITNEYR